MNKYQRHVADPLTMEKDRSHITKMILNLTLEIIYMLTGEDYTLVKKRSGEHVTGNHPHVSGEQNKTQTPTMKPPPSSSIHEKNHEQKILDLTNKIIELLTGEVPIRYQDVTVYFSMEEWEYLEEHKDLYRNIIKESDESLTSPDEADKRDLPEICTSPRYFPSEDPSAPPEDSHSFGGLPHSDTSTLQKDPTEARKTRKASFTPVSSLDCIGIGHTSVINFQTAKSTSSDELKGNNCIERVTERPPSYGPENLPITTIQIHRDYIPSFPSANIKEEPISSNEDSNLTDPRDPSPCIKEEPWEERNCTDICTAADHMQQYSSGHIELFVSYEEKPFMSNNIDLTTSPTEYVSSLSTNIKNEQQCKTSEKPYSCMECGKCFKLKSYLIAHQRRHTGEKPYSCMECGKSFSRMSNLANHKKVHTGEKPFSCSECGKSFARNSNLVVHQRVHTGEKPYPCLECGKCFFSNSYLVVHQRIHTGERPYSCSECLRRFISSSELLKHRKNHMRNEILKDSEYLL